MGKKNKLVAVVGWRWEPEWLVNEWVENISPVVDDFHIIDNRKQTGPWQDEGEYRKQQREIARRMGGEWFLLTSPDERVETRAQPLIRHTIDRGPKIPRAVCIREMWTPTQIRVDGQFRYRPRYRLFPVRDMFGNVKHRRIHSTILNNEARKRRKLLPDLDVYIYHLKNALKENRERRVAVMKELDKEIGKSREHSWDDFLKEDVILEDIEPGREFFPEYKGNFVWNPENS